MATSTLVQFLGDGITSPTSIAGDTSNRRQVLRPSSPGCNCSR